LVNNQNKLTIIFDKPLKGKKVQIEPFRGEPELNTKKDYVSTTLIKEKSIPKINKLDTTKLWLQTQCDECTIKEKEFLKGNYFKLKAKPLWTDPVKDSEITLYGYTGFYKPRGSSFGNVRIRANGTKKPHTGLDIFAEKGTDIFACLDGIVERIYGNSNDGSYGNVIVIEIDYVEYLIKSKNN